MAITRSRASNSGQPNSSSDDIIKPKKATTATKRKIKEQIIGQNQKPEIEKIPEPETKPAYNADQDQKLKVKQKPTAVESPSLEASNKASKKQKQSSKKKPLSSSPKQTKSDSSDAELHLQTKNLSNATKLVKQVDAEFPGIFTFKLNSTKPRSKSFEVSISNKTLWSGVKLGPPRRLKFPDPETISKLFNEFVSQQ
ncbi:Selenoprotein H [Smittium culicis]|uniref:Selenoprotein H n=1 Tax=Smittium culicis TaxID=133412 RepID=A0A1R1YJS4_9FUNG|nr:Selenoprotein H [Smittium culicis]